MIRQKILSLSGWSKISQENEVDDSPHTDDESARSLARWWKNLAIASWIVSFLIALGCVTYLRHTLNGCSTYWLPYELSMLFISIYKPLANTAAFEEGPQKELQSTYRTVHFSGGLSLKNGTFVRDIDPTLPQYVGEPSPAVDAEWDKLINREFIGILNLCNHQAVDIICSVEPISITFGGRYD